MIARWWRGWAATPENADAYEQLLRTTILPWVGSHAGHRGSYLVRRDVEGEVEFATLTLWDSLDSVKAFAGEDYEVAVVPDAGARGALALGRALGALRGGGQPGRLAVLGLRRRPPPLALRPRAIADGGAGSSARRLGLASAALARPRRPRRRARRLLDLRDRRPPPRRSPRPPRPRPRAVGASAASIASSSSSGGSSPPIGTTRVFTSTRTSSKTAIGTA